jgi:LmbE family N-acetylglucosaminyl deacetylase
MQMNKKKTVIKADTMVITPHPDDAEFNVAGTVARWTKEGKQVVYVLCTNGDKGTSDRTIKPKDLVKTREKEQLDAAKVLGVREVVFLRYPDQKLEETDEFRKKLVRLIRMYQPDTVVIDDPYRRYFYWHRDHRITARVALDAVFPFARDHLAYPDLLKAGFEPHKVKEVLLFGTEEPNVQFDITDTFATKLAALRCHHSQVGDWPDVEDMLREWATDMAKGTDFQLAEGFHRIEMW